MESLRAVEAAKECPICARIERRRNKRSKRRPGLYRSRGEVARRRRLWKKYREHPEKLREVRWVEVLPDGSKCDGRQRGLNDAS